MAKSNTFLLKLSGEILGSDKETFSPEKINFILNELSDALLDFNGKLGIVVGGGNIARGRELTALGIPRIRADHMGMLATCINGILLSEGLNKEGIRTRALSALSCANFLDVFSVETAFKLFEEGYVVIFTMGTGNPLFSTDTVAVLRAIELGIDTVLKATKVNGVYDRDPEVFSDAKMYRILTFEEAINKGLKVMDQEAFMLAKEHGVKIRVFNALVKGNLRKVISGEDVGTLIKNAI